MRLRLALPLVAAFVLGLAGCAPRVASRPPPGVASAQVNDRLMANDDESDSRVFAVRAIDGVAVKNAIDDQRRVGSGAAAGILPWLVARPVEARRASFLISGRFVARAPMDAIVRSVQGRNQDVEGLVSFTPRPDRTYRVTGVLDPKGSAVWIEDFDTGEPVTEKVVAAP